LEKTVEERLELLEQHARFNESIAAKVDGMFTEFRSRLRQIDRHTSTTSAWQLEHTMSVSSQFSDLGSKIAGLGKQGEQVDDRLAEIDVKLDRAVRLLTPESLG
jgi:hypothetical protein